jgi:carnitine O-acetyltransferase
LNGILTRVPRHLYALYCLLQREINESSQKPSPSGTPSPNGKTKAVTAGYTADGEANANGELNVDPAPHATSLPSIFTDHGWSILNTSIISTSNCGNPALRLFGFGPVAADGYGIGYIIKDDGISVYVTFNTQTVQ